jgi:hypothetical protein
MNDDVDDGVVKPHFYVEAVKDAAPSTSSSEPASSSSARASHPEWDRMDAMALLGGWTDPDDHRRYFLKSGDEVEARYALVRLLLDYSRPLSPSIREWLAALFVPSENRTGERMANRQIVNQSINNPTFTRPIEEKASERRSGFSLEFFASCASTKRPCF